MTDPITLGAAGEDPLALDLDRLIGTHLCIIGNSGAGKSGAIRRLLEETHGRIQHIVLDGEDEFYTLRERFDYVIAGGDDGDTPANLDNAAALARATLEHGFSLVAQLNDLGDDAAAFVGTFLEALIAAPRELWRPVLIVVDEAQRYVPVSGSTEGTEGVKALLQRGRKRGFTTVLASLAMSEINPRVRGLCNNWMLGRVGQALDRDTVAKQLGFRPSSDEARGLQALAPRHFWCFGPALAPAPMLVRIADVATTPVRPGQAKVATPPPPEALRAILSGLAVEKGGATVEAPATASPGERNLPDDRALALENARLRERIADLEAERDRLRSEVTDLGTEIARQHDLAREIANLAGELFSDPQSALGKSLQKDRIEAMRIGGEPKGAKRVVVEHAAKEAPPVPKPAPVRREPAAPGELGTTAQRLLDMAERIAPAKVPWGSLAGMIGIKARGGNFNAARKALRDSGKIIEDGDGVRFAGKAKSGMTRIEALDLWKSVLPNPAPRMIAALEAGPLSKVEIGEKLGVLPRGGNFNSGVANLIRNGVAVDVGGRLQLASPLPGERP